MAKPKKEVDQKDYFKDIHFFYEVLNQLKNVEEIKLLLKDLLTPCEIRMLRRRWHVACLLYEGFDIRQTAARAHVSTQTVNKIKIKLETEGTGGLKLALTRTRKDRETTQRQEIAASKKGIIDLKKIKGGGTLRWIFGES